MALRKIKELHDPHSKKKRTNYYLIWEKRNDSCLCLHFLPIAMNGPGVILPQEPKGRLTEKIKL